MKAWVIGVKRAKMKELWAKTPNWDDDVLATAGVSPIADSKFVRVKPAYVVEFYSTQEVAEKIHARLGADFGLGFLGERGVP